MRRLRELIQRGELLQSATLQCVLVGVVEGDRHLRREQLGFGQLALAVGGRIAGVDAHQDTLDAATVYHGHRQQCLRVQPHVQEAVAGIRRRHV